MGYRSEVFIGIPTNKQKEFESLPSNLKKMFNVISENKDITIYKANYLKWYDTYPEVETINKFIKNLCDIDLENSFLVCIGEDNLTHSEIGEWYDYINFYVEYEIL